MAGGTLDETCHLIAEAITFYIKGLREDGDPVPEPVTRAEEVEAA